jgi:hypothetical protein
MSGCHRESKMDVWLELSHMELRWMTAASFHLYIRENSRASTEFHLGLRTVTEKEAVMTMVRSHWSLRTRVTALETT